VQTYCGFAKSGREELLSTHSDHYVSNTAYSVASYIKGAVFLQQIKYIIGEEQFNRGLLKYFDTWKFKHPNPNDVIRIFEKESNLELDWFKEYFVYSLNTIDYGVKSVDSVSAKKVKITLERKKRMPMPLDVLVTYENGSQEMYYIPLDIMRGERPNDNPKLKYSLQKDWTWVYTTYDFEVNTNGKKIAKVVIDPSMRMADINREDNTWMGK
jgi:aminopeptidase N